MDIFECGAQLLNSLSFDEAKERPEKGREEKAREQEVKQEEEQEYIGGAVRGTGVAGCL